MQAVALTEVPWPEAERDVVLREERAEVVGTPPQEWHRTTTLVVESSERTAERMVSMSGWRLVGIG